MGMVQIERYTDMDTFFGITHNKPNNDIADARHVSAVIEKMSRHEVSQVISTYQLLPIYYYLNVLRDKKEPVKLSPFAKYIDIYLIELTGNNRHQLNKVAQDIVGDKYPISSAKAMRYAIITSLLHVYR